MTDILKLVVAIVVVSYFGRIYFRQVKKAKADGVFKGRYKGGSRFSYDAELNPKMFMFSLITRSIVAIVLFAVSAVLVLKLIVEVLALF